MSRWVECVDKNGKKQDKIDEVAFWMIMPGTWRWIPTSNPVSVSRFGVVPDDEALEATKSVYEHDDVEVRKSHKLIRVVSKSGKETIMEFPNSHSGKIWIWDFEANTGKQAINRLKDLFREVREVTM